MKQHLGRARQISYAKQENFSRPLTSFISGPCSVFLNLHCMTPNFSLKGAYRPHTHVYTQEDVKDIIEYARNRGIRVIAEFDVPGHTESWEPGNPGLLTPCYHNGAPTGQYGPMDPTKRSVFDFLHRFFKEVTTVFPDKYLHIGGDEVSLDCWKSNPSTSSYVQKYHKGNFRALESEFINKMLDIIKSYPTKNGYIGKWSR